MAAVAVTHSVTVKQRTNWACQRLRYRIKPGSHLELQPPTRIQSQARAPASICAYQRLGHSLVSATAGLGGDISGVGSHWCVSGTCSLVCNWGTARVCKEVVGVSTNNQVQARYSSSHCKVTLVACIASGGSKSYMLTQTAPQQLGTGQHAALPAMRLTGPATLYTANAEHNNRTRQCRACMFLHLPDIYTVNV